jgi:sec-independent protein translocase protein TatA
MYGLGHTWELVVILIIALIVFGPMRLPQLGAGIAKSIRDFRKSTGEGQDQRAAERRAALPAAKQYDVVGRGLRSFRDGLADLKEETGIDTLQRDLRHGVADLREASGIEELHHGVTKGIAELREGSGIDKARRELRNLHR